jgi:hypothetical protein
VRSIEPLTAEEQALSVCFDTQDLDARTQSGIEQIRALARRLLPSPASQDSNGGIP